MLEAKDVTIMAGDSVLVEHLSFVAEPGKLTCLEGISDASATVVARALLGLWPVASGYVTFCGEVVSAQSGPWLRKQMAYVPWSLPDGFGGCPVAFGSVEEALKEVDARTKRVVVVEQAGDAAAHELQRLADSGLAVVVVRASH